MSRRSASLFLLCGLAFGCASPAGQSGTGNIFSDAGTVCGPDGGADGSVATDAGGGTDAGPVDVKTCENACSEGDKRCDAAGVQVCGDNDDDGCTEWGKPQPCDKGQACDKGVCVNQRPKDA